MTDPSFFPELALATAGAALAIIGGLWWAQTQTQRRRRQAEQARDQAQALLDLTPDALWTVDADGVHPANSAAKALAAAGALEHLAAAAPPAAATGRDQTGSLSTLIAGEEKLFSVLARSMDDGRARLYRAQDLTRLTAAQEELARSLAAHDDALELVKSAVAIYGPDKTLRFANQAFAALWGLDPDWLAAGPTFGEVLERLRADRRLPEVADFPSYRRGRLALFERLTAPREDMLHLPDGRALREVIAPHPLGGLMVMFDDVSGALALEAEFNTLTAVQAETIDHALEGVAVFGPDRRLRLSNPAFRALWGFDAERLAQRPTAAELLDAARDLAPPGVDWGLLRATLLHGLVDRRMWRGEVQRADGRVLDCAVLPLPDGATLCAFLDVTARDQAERALRERNEALEAADRLKTDFLANISYELRTPMNAILGFSEVLASRIFGDLTPRQQDYAESIQQAGQKLLASIDDVIDLASIEAGCLALEHDPHDVAGLLEGARALIAERARLKRLTLTVDCPPDLGAIDCDARRLKQAIYALLSNACRLTPAGGAVALSAWAEGEETVAIQVSDNGMGLPSGDWGGGGGDRPLDRGGVFDAQGGVGLGMTLVRGFIALHGGRVDITSAPSRGVAAVIRLPRRQPDASGADRGGR